MHASENIFVNSSIIFLKVLYANGISSHARPLFTQFSSGPISKMDHVLLARLEMLSSNRKQSTHHFINLISIQSTDQIRGRHHAIFNEKDTHCIADFSSTCFTDPFFEKLTSSSKKYENKAKKVCKSYCRPMLSMLACVYLFLFPCEAINAEVEQSDHHQEEELQCSVVNCLRWSAVKTTTNFPLLALSRDFIFLLIDLCNSG